MKIDPNKISEEEKQKQIEEMWKKHEQQNAEPDLRYSFHEDDDDFFDDDYD